MRGASHDRYRFDCFVISQATAEYAQRKEQHHVTAKHETHSVWRNEVEKNGQTVVRHSVRIQKQFRKEGGDYENTEYYFPDDLPKLALVAQEAFRFLSLKESKDAEETVPV